MNDDLKLMLEDMQRAPEYFKPTNFWGSGLPDIIKDIEDKGIENFREHPSAAFFYVPRYASSTYSKAPDFFNKVLSKLPPRKKKRWETRLKRSDRAWNDYRLYKSGEVSGGIPLQEVSESTFGGGERFDFEGRSYSRSMLNYLRALNLLNQCPSADGIKSCLEIGGGYGTLGEILLTAQPGGFYVNVDIPPVAAVSTWYLSQVFGESNVLSYTESREMESFDLEQLSSKYRAIVLCPWQLPQIQGQFDLFANFMSFQEMEPAVVENYISLVQPLVKDYALIRNSALGKVIAKKEGDVGVISPVLINDIVEQFREFEVIARDSISHGEKTMDGSYCSEVVVLKR